mgnify:FL=1
MDILLNHTALSYLYCDRAFAHLILRNNLSKYDNSYASDGRRLHLFFQQVDSGAEPDLTLLSSPELMKMGLMYQNFRPLGNKVLRSTDGNLCLEMRFLYKLREIDDITYYFTGTIDRIDTDGNLIRVIDHKTTRMANLDNALRAWCTSIQIPLYLFTVRHVLKDKIQDLDTDKLVGHYHVVGLSAGKFKLSPVIQEDTELVQDLLVRATEHVHRLVHRKIEEIFPNGRYHNACKSCVLSDICSARAEVRNELLNEEGDEPYDPRTWHGN